MKNVSDCFEQLAPMLDDVVARINSFGLHAFECATLSALAISRISLGTRISIAQASDGGRELTPEEREELMGLLMESMAALDLHDGKIQ